MVNNKTVMIMVVVLSEFNYENLELKTKSVIYIALKISRDRNCIGYRPYNKSTGQYGPYTWQTYKQISERIDNFGSGILHLNENVSSKMRSSHNIY